MEIVKVAQMANDAAQLTNFASTGVSPQLWSGLTDSQRHDVIATAQSEVGSSMDEAGLREWLSNKRAAGEMTSDQASHAAFQSVCFSSRTDTAEYTPPV